MERAARHFQTGAYDQASTFCKKILDSNPRHTGALGLLGLVSAIHGKLPAAIDLFRRAIRIEPENTVLNKNLARALVTEGRYEEGLKYYSRVATLLPENSEAYYDIACTYLKMGDADKAELHFNCALSLNQNNVNARVNLGGLLRMQGRHPEAIKHYELALKMSPTLREALTGLGLALQETGNLVTARKVLDRATNLYPEDADAHFNKALCHLINADYERGWTEYEWRWKRPGKQPRNFNHPIWRGEPLGNRTILIYAEQGIGDEIMFSSCLPDIQAQARHVIIDCEPRLAPLFSRSFPRATIHGRYQNTTDTRIDHGVRIDMQSPAGSLPLYLRKTTSDFPNTGSYLVADPHTRAGWEKRLNMPGKGLKIGISWKGGGTPLTNSTRSIELKCWHEILKQERVHFINLQHGESRREADDIKNQTGVTIHSFPEIDPLIELDNFAALISAMDLVISIDNSTVHLAGALGVPVWLLLPVVPDWRWTMEGDKTPWYSSVRMFRKQQGQKWEDLLITVSEELAALLRTAQSVND